MKKIAFLLVICMCSCSNTLPITFLSNQLLTPELTVSSLFFTTEQEIEEWINLLESILKDIDYELEEIEWQKYSKIAMKPMGLEERVAYLKGLTSEECAQLDEKRNEVFLNDFPELEKRLLKREKELKAELIRLATQNVLTITALKKRSISNPYLSRKVYLLYYMFLDSVVSNDERVIDAENLVKKVYQDFDFIDCLKKKLTNKEYAYVETEYELSVQGLDDTIATTILKNEPNRKIRKAVWELMPERGKVLFPYRLELVRIQNTVMRELCAKYDLNYANYFDFMFESREFDDNFYEDFMEKIAKGTKKAAQRAVKRGRNQLGVSSFELWDVWFMDNELFRKVEPYFTSDKKKEMVKELFEGWGHDISKLHLDMNPRQGKLYNKFPHAGVCFPRIRRLMIAAGGKKAGSFEMQVAGHETGHGVHALGIDKELGHLLSDNNLIISEAMARRGEFSLVDPKVMKEKLGVPEELIAPFLFALTQRELLEFRGVLDYVGGMRDLDRKMYETVELFDTKPEEYKKQYQDKEILRVLTEYYWDESADKRGIPNLGLLSKLSKKKRAQQMEYYYNMPLWAGLYHFNVTTAYIPLSYIFASALHAQNHHVLTKKLNKSSLIGDPRAGKWYTDKYYKWGDQHPWETLVQVATGESLNPQYYIEEMTRTYEEIKQYVNLILGKPQIQKNPVVFFLDRFAQSHFVVYYAYLQRRIEGAL